MDDFFKKTYNLLDELKISQSTETMKEIETLWKDNIVHVNNPSINILLPNPKESFLIDQSLLHYFLEQDDKLASIFFSELQADLSSKEKSHLKTFIKNFKNVKEIKEEIKNDKFTKLDKFLEANTKFKGNIRLEYESKKLKFQNIYRTNKKEGILFLRNEMTQFINDEEYREDLRKFLLILVENNDLDLNNKVIGILVKQSSKVYNIPIRSFLHELFLAGKKALPVLREATGTFSEVELKNLLERETLIRLPINELYHSVFVCPVLKNACDSTNLPCLLECGHVISQNAISQITKTGNKSTLKCPYCPAQSNFEKGKLLFIRK